MKQDTHGSTQWEPTIGVDLDGTLAEYHGWKGETHIGKPIVGMVEHILKAKAEGKKIFIFSARCTDERNAQIIRDWMYENEIPFDGVTNVKMKEFVEIWDDRARQVPRNSGTFLEDSYPAQDTSGEKASSTSIEEGCSLDNQVGGNHYSKLVIQPAEYCEYNGIPSLESAVIKYVTRHEDKGGEQDIDKAIDLLNMIKDMRYHNAGKEALLKRIANLIKD